MTPDIKPDISPYIRPAIATTGFGVPIPTSSSALGKQTDSAMPTSCVGKDKAESKADGKKRKLASTSSTASGSRDSSKRAMSVMPKSGSASTASTLGTAKGTDKAEKEEKEETLTLNPRYSDPRADLHIMSTDSVLFKCHMHMLAGYCDLIAILISTKDCPAGTVADTPANASLIQGTDIARLDVPADSSIVLIFLNYIMSRPYIRYSTIEEDLTDAVKSEQLFDLADMLGCDDLVDAARKALCRYASAAKLFQLGLRHHYDLRFLLAGFDALETGHVVDLWDKNDTLADLPPALLSQIVRRRFMRSPTDRSDMWPRDENGLHAIVLALQRVGSGEVAD